MFKILQYIIKALFFALFVCCYPIMFIVGMTFRRNDSFAKTFSETNEIYKYIWNDGELD